VSVQTSNYRKFQTRNPIVRRLINGFYRKLREMLEVHADQRQSLLDAGCGEGETLRRLSKCLPQHVLGFDLNPDSIAFAEQHTPGQLCVADIYHTGYPDDAFDTVLCLEVLEHLDQPELALAELARIARIEMIISVPHEPWFRLGSLMRGKHIARWGNHPEHINHWNPKKFNQWLSHHATVQQIVNAFPWTIARCEPTRP